MKIKEVRDLPRKGKSQCLHGMQETKASLVLAHRRVMGPTIPCYDLEVLSILSLTLVNLRASYSSLVLKRPPTQWEGTFSILSTFPGAFFLEQTLGWGCLEVTVVRMSAAPL